MNWFAISATISAISAVISAIGILVNAIVSKRLANMNRQTTLDVNSENRQTTLEINKLNRELSEQLHQLALSRAKREQLLSIWKEMIVISRISSEDPNPEEVRIALNLLSLVAKCAELELVDP